MKSIPLALALALAAGPVLAQEQAPQELQIFRDGDATMTCQQIADEAAGLSQQMGGERGGGVFGSVMGVARTGAAMVIPGAGLAIAGADAINRPERERREAREAAVEHRWYYLNGVYTGQRCGTATEAASPSATPAPPAPAN